MTFGGTPFFALSKLLASTGYVVQELVRLADEIRVLLRC